jgi:hypothetical protein
MLEKRGLPVPIEISTELKVKILRDRAAIWAPYSRNYEAMLERGTHDLVRAECLEPTTLGQLLAAAKQSLSELAPESVKVERRQRPDPCGEGSIGFLALIESRPMTDAQYAQHIEVHWARYQRELAEKAGIVSEHETYARLQVKYGPPTGGTHSSANTPK